MRTPMGSFLHAGIEMLRPGGRLGDFIVPRSMLSGLYFQNLRKIIEERTRLEELLAVGRAKERLPAGPPGHDDCRVPAARPGRGRNARPVRAGIVRDVNELANGGPAHVLAEAGQVARRLNGTTVRFVSDREKTYSLLDKILARHPLLGGPGVACPAKTGPIVWNRVKATCAPRPAARRCLCSGRPT